MPGTYISPTGNPEVWDEKPQGYFASWEAYKQAHPDPVPTPEELDAREIDKIKEKLSLLDTESARPMRAILAGTDAQDDRARLAELEAEARELRFELWEITHAAPEPDEEAT
jgi:hypothetical protein